MFLQRKAKFKIKQCRMSLVGWLRRGNSNSKKELMELKREQNILEAISFDINKLKLLKNELSKAYRDEEIYWK